MQLKVNEYEILSDLWFAMSNSPINERLGLADRKDFETLYQKAGEVLDAVRRRHWEQNKKTAHYIANKRKANKNYAR